MNLLLTSLLISSVVFSKKVIFGEYKLLKKNMKKAIYIFSLVLLFSSCTNTDDNKIEPIIESDTILVKKIVYNIEEEAITRNYNYNKNRLLNVTDVEGNEVETYVYENDLLTRVNYLKDDGYVTLEHDLNNNSINITEVFDDFTSNLKITYNNNGSIRIEAYSNNVLIDNGEIIVDDNGNITKESYSSGLIYEYTYDTKNNAFKNMEMVEIFHLLEILTEYGDGWSGNLNNITNWTETYEEEEYNDSWTYQYNELDYPISAIYFYDGIEESSLEYFYE